MEYDTFDICEAYYLFARHYHVGGDTDGARGNGYFARLNRLEFEPGAALRDNDEPDDALTPNGAEIYRQLARDHDAGEAWHRTRPTSLSLWPDGYVRAGRRQRLEQ